MSEAVGRVLGTQDAMPLDFWVGVAEGQYIQLDDVVVVETPLPDGRVIRLFGVVDVVRARHEGAKFDSDVFLIEEGVLPASVAQAAHVRVTRVEPEVFVPPRPGQEVARATGVDRDQALFFDKMERRLPIGLSRDGEPVFANLDFLDGTRGAHVNISGISGVATKTTYATFLLHGLFTAPPNSRYKYSFGVNRRQTWHGEAEPIAAAVGLGSERGALRGNVRTDSSQDASLNRVTHRFVHCDHPRDGTSAHRQVLLSSILG